MNITPKLGSPKNVGEYLDKLSDYHLSKRALPCGVTTYRIVSVRHDWSITS
jgi:hypothetical protein